MFEALGVNWQLLLFQVFNFLILLFLLHRILYRPILRILDERRERIRTDLDEARQLREAAAQDRAEYQRQLEQVRDESRAILDEASSVAERIRAEARRQAEEEQERALQRAREAIQRERDHAIAELRREVADLAIDAASQVIRRNLDSSEQRRLVEEVLAEVESR
jgi:F-type H+-transporting ATPase subunit b